MTTTLNNISYDEILRQAAELGASDVHLKVGVVPVVRKLGVLRPIIVSKPAIERCAI